MRPTHNPIQDGICDARIVEQVMDDHPAPGFPPMDLHSRGRELLAADAGLKPWFMQTDDPNFDVTDAAS